MYYVFIEYYLESDIRWHLMAYRYFIVCLFPLTKSHFCYVASRI